MTWSWSYTADGIANIADQIARKCCDNPEWGRTVLAEIRTAEELRAQGEEGEPFDSEVFRGHYDRIVADDLPDDVIADAIMRFAEAQALCSRGGHEVYVCPYSDCHTVTPDPVEADTPGGNAAAVARAATALDAVMEATGYDDRDSAVSDLLADLMHYCRDRDISFEAKLTTARIYFQSGD